MKLNVFSLSQNYSGDTFPVGCAFDESNVHHKVNIVDSISL